MQIKYTTTKSLPNDSLDTDTPPSVSPSSTYTVAPTPLPTDSRTTPSQSGYGANSESALVGGIIGAVSAIAALVLLFLIVLTIFLVLLTKKRGQKLYNTVSVPPQPQTDIDSTAYMYSQIDSQGIEVP